MNVSLLCMGTNPEMRIGLNEIEMLTNCTMSNVCLFLLYGCKSEATLYKN